MSRAKQYLHLVKEAAASWSQHESPRLGAALAFYTIFAIAPLLIIILAIAGFVFGEEAAHRQLFAEFSRLLGEEGGRALESVLAAGKESGLGTKATVIALLTLVLGASGVFVQLQDSINAVWNLRPKPGRKLRRFLKVRLLSFAMVVAIGFLLLVSLVINAAIAAVGKYMSGWIPGQEAFWQAVNFVLSIGVVTLLFAIIFKVLPDAKIAWRDVWIGSLLTSALFSIGKFLLSLYLGKSSVASVYGAAGSLVVVLVWVYYSSQIFLFGAEFTRLYAIRCGSHVRPAAGAQFVKLEEAKVSEAAAAHKKKVNSPKQKAA